MFRSFLFTFLFIAGSFYTALAGTSAEGKYFVSLTSREKKRSITCHVFLVNGISL